MQRTRTTLCVAIAFTNSGVNAIVFWKGPNKRLNPSGSMPALLNRRGYLPN
jgi:hypothetical protein